MNYDNRSKTILIKYMYHQVPVVQQLDNAKPIHWINLHPVKDAIGFSNAYSLNNELNSG